MNNFYPKNKRLAVIAAAFYALHALFTLAAKFLRIFVSQPSENYVLAESIFSAAAFIILPAAVFLLSSRVCRNNARTAMQAAFGSRLFSLAAYVFSMFSTDSINSLAFVFCLLLGAAILEILSFALIAVSMRRYDTEKAFAVSAAFFAGLYHIATLIQLYAGIKLLGAGNFVRWMNILSLSTKAGLFLALLRGAVCALVYVFIFLALREAPEDETAS